MLTKNAIRFTMKKTFVECLSIKKNYPKPGLIALISKVNATQNKFSNNNQ